jgi:adenylylsulfate kinase
MGDPLATTERCLIVNAVAPTDDSGVTVWLTGLPSAGKSTIARGVAARLLDIGHRVQVLDGDEIRKSFTLDLGFSRFDRIENVRRIGALALMLASHGVISLVPVIAPYRESRDAVRARHAEHGIDYVEVFVATPVEVCSRRDVKGLYQRQRRGELTGLTGVDDPYEQPQRPELLVLAHQQPVYESVDTVLRYLLDRLPT